MPASADDKIQINIKTPGGTLINLYNPDIGGMSKLLEDVEGIAPQIAAIEKVFGATAAAKPITSTNQKAAPFPTNGGAAPDACPNCDHGQKVFKQGVSSVGPWTAWMCPAPKDTPGRCAPQYNN